MIFIVLLMLITPFSFAKTITVGELFESEKKEEAQEPSSRETSGTTIYFYAGSKLIASKNTETFMSKIGFSNERHLIKISQIPS